MIAKTRAQVFEGVRHRLGIRTPIQMNIPGAKEGDVPPSQSWPDNYYLREVLDETLSEINIECDLSTTNRVFTKAVSAQTADGPYYLGWNELGPTFTPGGINMIRSVGWANTGDSQVTYLVPSTPEMWERDNVDWALYTAGTPRWVAADAGRLWILPSPSAAGTLYFTAQTSFSSPQSDIDTLGFLPADHYVLVMNLMAKNVADALPGDVEMMARSKALAPRILRGFELLKRQNNNQLTQLDTSIDFKAYRLTGGRTR